MASRKNRPAGRKSSEEPREQHEEFRERRDAMYAAVNNAWNFPNPAAAGELAQAAVAEAHSMDAKKGVEARRKNRLTAPHEDEALELLRRTRRLKPKTSSTYTVGKELAKKFGASGKTWERFVIDAENDGLVPKQIKTRAVRVR
jgi:hypothetical protein